MLPPSPTVDDIIQGWQYQATCDLPGKNTSHRVTMGVIWESEVIDIAVSTGRQVHPADTLSRTAIVKLETLVQAIIQIDADKFIDQDDEFHNNELKGLLRKCLQNSAPVITEFLWNFYEQLREKQDLSFRTAVDEIKKSTRLPGELESLGEKPSESSTSGEVGGDLQK